MELRLVLLKQVNQDRDVNRVYPGYPEGATSGFEGKSLMYQSYHQETKTLTVEDDSKRWNS